MNLPVTIVVIDNHGYGSTRNYERQYIAEKGPEANPQKPGYLNMDMRTMGPDLKAMIEGFGIPCRRLTPGDDLRAAVEQAWAESSSRSGEHMCELKSLMSITFAGFILK